MTTAADPAASLMPAEPRKIRTTTASTQIRSAAIVRFVRMNLDRRAGVPAASGWWGRVSVALIPSSVSGSGPLRHAEADHAPVLHEISGAGNRELNGATRLERDR